MHFPKQLVQLAQQRALSAFDTLTGHTLAEAENAMAQASRTASGDEASALSAARSLVRYEGEALRARMGRQFAALLERAMQTMHTDLRAGLRNVRFDELTLLDDSVMERQIGVDRLVQRLRDADELSLGRLNLIIAQLHGVSEVRERENPFRPYLLARAMFEAVNEMASGELRVRILFDHLSGAMAAHLHDYYGPLLDLFEQRGVFGKLTARPSQLTRAERERLAWQRASEHALQAPAAGVAAAAPAIDDPQHAMRLRLLPKLQRMMAGGPAVDTPFPDLDGFQDAEEMRALVRRIGSQGGAGRPGAIARAPAPTAKLLEALRAAQRDSLGAQAAREQGAPLELAGRIASQDGASRGERQRIELVALLFEFMLEDSLLDPALRKEIGRLFVPFARLAMAQPDMLQDAGHPARLLLDRIGTLAAASGPDTPRRDVLDSAVRRAVDHVLRDFDGDAGVFAAAERAFGQDVAAWLQGSGSARVTTAGIAAAILDAETLHLRLASGSSALERLLAPLQLDARLAAFLRSSWVQVLARSAPGETGQGALLADLVWSTQHKPDPAQHSALMRMLPELVKRVRDGLSRLGLPEAQAKAALDELVAVHMEVMFNRQAHSAGMMALDALRAHFAPLDAPGAIGAASDAVAWLQRAELEAALARQGIVVDIESGPDDLAPAPGDAGLLEAFRPGAGVEFFEGGAYVGARLTVAGKAGGAFLFSIPGRAAPVVYLRAALLEALREEAVRPLEYAPLFERAVEALTVSAETLSA